MRPLRIRRKLNLPPLFSLIALIAVSNCLRPVRFPVKRFHANDIFVPIFAKKRRMRRDFIQLLNLKPASNGGFLDSVPICLFGARIVPNPQRVARYSRMETIPATD